MPQPIILDPTMPLFEGDEDWIACWKHRNETDVLLENQTSAETVAVMLDEVDNAMKMLVALRSLEVSNVDLDGELVNTGYLGEKWDPSSTGDLPGHYHEYFVAVEDMSAANFSGRRTTTSSTQSGPVRAEASILKDEESDKLAQLEINTALSDVMEQLAEDEQVEREEKLDHFEDMAAEDLNETVMVMAQTHAKEKARPRMFCFSLMPSSGAKAWLLQAQHVVRQSIFGCNGFAVFAGNEKPKGEEIKAMHIIFIDGTEAEETFDGGTYQGSLKSDFAAAAWTVLKRSHIVSRYDWIVKVEADAVFFPERLMEMLETTKPMSEAKPSSAMYLQNCVMKDGSGDIKMHPALEVLSSAAATEFMEASSQGGECYENFGPWARTAWAEGRYLQECLALLNVQAVAADGALSSENCAVSGEALEFTGLELRKRACMGGAVAVHRVTSIEDYMLCLGHTSV